MAELDLRILEKKVVRRFTDSPHTGEDWTRLRQSGPSTTTDSGRLATPAAVAQGFRAFVDPGSGKATVKDKGGDKQDETLTLYVCQFQIQNGLNEEVEFIAADPPTRRRGDTVRRESDAKKYEVMVARHWKAGRFWALDCKQVQGG